MSASLGRLRLAVGAVVVLVLLAASFYAFLEREKTANPGLGATGAVRSTVARPLPAKKIRMILEESYGDVEAGKRPNLEFHRVTKCLLAPVGAELVPAFASEYDATLTVQVVGKRSSAAYQTLRGTSVGLLATGAELSGKILFELPRRKPVEESFLGKFAPPEAVSDPLFRPNPLEQAFYLEGSYVWKVSEVIGVVYGYVPLAAVALGQTEDLPYPQSWAVRRAAAGALGKLGDPEGIKELAAALESENDLRLRATEALGWTRSPAAVEPLLAELRRSDQPYYDRGLVAEALSEIGNGRAVPPLRTILTDEKQDAHVRAAAARALGKCKDLSVTATLASMLRHPKAEIRLASAQGLGELKDTRAVSALIAVLGVYDLNVNFAVEEALQRITGCNFDANEQGCKASWAAQPQPEALPKAP